MSDIAIKVEGLGKEYIIGQQKQGDIMNSFSTGWKQLFQKGKTKESFWALKDLNFEIKKGEAVGIIGRNGAGKSTLLKILSRITEPTTGRFEINGRVSSLLEVGTGFHPELTGRENIYLNGTILGMNRKEIKQKFDEIIDFSGVEKFLDTPVKHYSSGMKVRLAFSVAAHLEPEILIIDEVLAVGDAEFQKKCLGKMDEVSKGEGRTVIFVSHNMAAVEGLCSKGVLLKDGTISKVSSPQDVVREYLKINDNVTIQLNKIPSVGNKKVTFKKMELWADNEKCTINNSYIQIPFYSKVEFILTVDKNEDINKIVYFAITILDNNRTKVSTLENLYRSCGINLENEKTIEIICCVENLPLNPGLYSIDLWCSDGYETFQKIENAYAVEIIENDFYATGKMQTKEKHGYLNLQNTWKLGI